MPPRSTIGDNPLDALIPAGLGVPSRASAPTTARAPARPKKIPKERLTVHLPVDLINRVKNSVYWTPGLTLASLAEQALARAVAEREAERGEPFPQRDQELKGGRPMK
jgi:hypothetical protein